MSVDFYPAIVTIVDVPRSESVKPALRCACDELFESGDERICAACCARVNMSNANAADVMRYLGIESEPYGKIEADKLAELCRAAIADPNRARPRFGVITKRVVMVGRDAEYLPRQARALLVLATLARSCGWVAWS